MAAPYLRQLDGKMQIVHLVRDGRDVAASARRMWQKPMEVRRLLPKLVAFPVSALPDYAVRYARAYLRRLVDPEHRVESWGPRFSGIDDLARSVSLVELCGLQWQRCLERAEEQLAGLPPSDVLEVRYEQLVREPEDTLARIMAFLELELTSQVRRYAREQVTTANVGKWRGQLDPGEQESLVSQIGPTLQRLGYTS